MIMNVTTILTGVNILLVLGLMFVYVKSCMKIKSGFIVGLLIFAALFLIQNVVSFYYFVTMMPYYVNGVDIHVLVLTILQTLAFGVLTYNTWR